MPEQEDNSVTKKGRNVGEDRDVFFNESIRRKDGVYAVWHSGPYTDRTESITFIIDGGGSAITAGIKGDLLIPFNATIKSVTLLADQTGNFVLDIWNDLIGNFPPTVADSITASAKPTLTAQDTYQDATLPGWNITLDKNDVLRFNVDSSSTVERVTVILEVDKPVSVNNDATLFFTAFHPMEVINISAVYENPATGTPPITLDVERLQGTSNPGTGDSLLVALFDLDGTQNTVFNKKGRQLTSARKLSPNDRLAVRTAGSLVDFSNVVVTCYLKFFGRGDYY